MKKVFGALLVVVTLAFFSCRKNTVKPRETTGNTNQQETSISQGTTNSTPAPDSLDNVKGWLRLQLTKDSINADNILVAFDPSAQTTYVPGKDAPTLQGFGQVSLSCLSSNNVPLSIYSLPLTSKGVCIGLRVNAQHDGIYTMNLKDLKSIPEAYDLWLMDKYRKDSVELRYNNAYAFNIIKSDTSSFGLNRFKLVVRTR